MLPMLGILKLKAKDVIGFTVTQLVVHFPLVLFLLWFLVERSAIPSNFLI